jgi:hypothetical protein
MNETVQIFFESVIEPELKEFILGQTPGSTYEAPGLFVMTWLDDESLQITGENGEVLVFKRVKPLDYN